jgi:DNA-binding transcriptional LysR family regulator
MVVHAGQVKVSSAMAKDIDLNLLRTLEALLTERNVTRAAAMLGTTQPAVSAQLVRLRKMFDDDLLVASNRGMTPTPRALELAPELSQLLGGFRAMVYPEEFDPATANATIRVSASDVAQGQLARWFGDLSRRAPGLKVDFVTGTRSALIDIESDMARGDVDIGISLLTHFEGRLHARKLFDEHVVCVMRKDHPFTRDTLSEEDMAGFRTVMVAPLSNEFPGMLEALRKRPDFMPNVVVSVSTFLVAEQVLVESDFVALLPAQVARRMPSLKQYPVPYALPAIEIGMGWHTRTHRSAMHRWVRDEMTTELTHAQGRG